MYMPNQVTREPDHPPGTLSYIGVCSSFVPCESKIARHFHDTTDTDCT
jgi:hypothetical protein